MRWTPRVRRSAKIECFRNGFCDIADGARRSGTAALTSMPLPDLKVLTRDPEFKGVEISQDEFEEVWTTRQYHPSEPEALP